MDLIENATTELRTVAEDALAAFGSLSAVQLNWKPAAESWSIAQCLDHLILTNGQMISTIEPKIAGAGNSLVERFSLLSGFFGSYITRTLKDDAKKVKAPSEKIVPPSDIDADIVAQFCEEQKKVIATITNAGKLDQDKTILTSPFMSLLTYSLRDALEIIVEHEKRHIRQAKRVKEAAGFPHGEEQI